MNASPVSVSTRLALRAQRGDRRAFEELYDRHAAGVARALASFAGPDRVELDDLVQEVFLRVIDHIRAYRPTRPFESWLFTVALNVGRNHVRQRRRSMVVESDDPRIVDIRGPDTPDPVERTDLWRAISRLPPDLRDVVALRVGSDLDYEQIAAVLEIPAGTARRRMHSATQRIQARWDIDTSTERKQDGRT